VIAELEELDPAFSEPQAVPTKWSAAQEQLAAAKTYVLTTVRPDGRPHATTIAGVWLDGALQFTTGKSERKARNIAAGNDHVLVAVANSGWQGLDVVIEGHAVPVSDPDRLSRMADAFTTKYDDFFGLWVERGRLQGAGAPDEILAFEIRPDKAFGFAKGDSFSQTRWRFRPPAAD
jgi:nitroimidazol reductase NimA-like FMN-containing flavoprotein (pyridoxamine 5'-phosphate oxidase superfamily)